MLISLIALTLANAPAVAEPELITGPITMKPSEIRAYNASLPRDHPNYIRCTTEEETGSLVRKRSTCRTNAEWRRIEDGGERAAREMVEELQKGWTKG